MDIDPFDGVECEKIKLIRELSNEWWQYLYSENKTPKEINFADFLSAYYKACKKVGKIMDVDIEELEKYNPYDYIEVTDGFFL